MQARLFIVACASAAVLATACTSNTNRNATDQTTAAKPAGTSGAAEDNTAKAQPITLTGCLQRGDGSDFILTEVNEPSGGSVKSGAPQSDKVEREQINAAEHSYRLNADRVDKDDLGKFVGKQVRVSGTLAKRGDVNEKVGTSGSSDRDKRDNDRTKIHESDLAQVDVADVQQVAAACGGHAMKPRAK